MPRNRTIYNVMALFASAGNNVTGNQIGANDIIQVPRVQSFDEDFTRTFTDVNQYGNLAAIDRLEVEAPEVTASFSYYLSDGKSERAIGLMAAPSGTTTQLTSILSGIVNKTEEPKNYYLAITSEGFDANGNTSTTTGVIGLGNASVTSYSVSAAVGDIPTADVELEALNLRVYSNASTQQDVPAIITSGEVDGQPASGKFLIPRAYAYTGAAIPNALQPGDITFNLPQNSALGFSETDLKVQDFTISVDLPRSPIQKLGSRYGISRELDFPITASIEVNAEVGDLTNDNLVNQLCAGNEFTFDIRMNKPYCAGGPAGTTTVIPAMIFQVRKAKLVSQNFSSSIGDNATMSATYEVSIGSASETDRGIFVSGSYVNINNA
jgi:hypothetical protein